MTANDEIAPDKATAPGMDDGRLAAVRAPRTLGHQPALDGFRGLAVAMVVVGHVQFEMLPNNSVGMLLHQSASGGWLGVDLFFVLSGFLITSLLLGELHRSGRVSMAGFYVRRGLRLLPALYVFLALHAAYAAVVGLDLEAEKQTVAAAMFYVANWQTVWDETTLQFGLGHLWSLAVEEQFYFVWPAVLAIAFTKLRRTNVPLALTAVIVFVAVYRAVVFDGSPRWMRSYTGTDTRIDSLLIGALAGWLWIHRLVPRYPQSAVASAAAALFGVLAWKADPASPFWRSGGHTLAALVAALMLLALLEGKWRARWLFVSRPMRLLGRVSYGLYIWHFPVFVGFAALRGSMPWWALLLLALGTTTVLVALSWHLVERPAQRLRRH